MIIQLSSTLIILSLIRCHARKQFVHIPSFIVAKNHMLIVISTYVKPSWSQGGFPAQLLGIGGEFVDLDRPWELYEAYSWGVGEDESGDGLYCGFEGVVRAAVIGV